jgi:hypothetical protein
VACPWWGRAQAARQVPGKIIFFKLYFLNYIYLLSYIYSRSHSCNTVHSFISIHPKPLSMGPHSLWSSVGKISTVSSRDMNPAFLPAGQRTTSWMNYVAPSEFWITYYSAPWATLQPKAMHICNTRVTGDDWKTFCASQDPGKRSQRLSIWIQCIIWPSQN